MSPGLSHARAQLSQACSLCMLLEYGLRQVEQLETGLESWQFHGEEDNRNT